MLVIAGWTKSVVKEEVITSGVITFINILIWYYVLETVVNDINNLSLVLLYACGCAIGTMLASAAPTYLKDWKKNKIILWLKRF